MSYTPVSIEKFVAKFIAKISGGTIIFYQGGTKTPTYVGHPLVRGVLPVLGFNIENPAGTFNVVDGNMTVQLAEQILNYPNYTVPNFFRIYTPQGVAVYQDECIAFGRDHVSPSEVVLVSKMRDDEYYTPGVSIYTANRIGLTKLPPNYKCTLNSIKIWI